MKNKTKYKEDDGHTIYNMNIDGMPGYKKPSATDSYVTKKEKRAMIKACYRVYFIPLLILSHILKLFSSFSVSHASLLLFFCISYG